MSAISTNVWADARIYSPSVNEELLDALMLYHEACEKDTNATLIWQTVQQATLVVFFYCAPVENPAVFSSFSDIPSLTSIVPPGINTVYGVTQGLADFMTAGAML
jgi:hypothetical protein